MYVPEVKMVGSIREIPSVHCTLVFVNIVGPNNMPARMLQSETHQTYTRKKLSNRLFISHLIVPFLNASKLLLPLLHVPKSSALSNLYFVEYASQYDRVEYSDGFSLPSILDWSLAYDSV